MGQVSRLGLARTCLAQVLTQVLGDMPGAGLHPDISPVHPLVGAGARWGRAQLHARPPSPFPTQHQHPWLSPQAGVGWTLRTSELESKSSKVPNAQVTHGGLSISMARDARDRCLQGAATSLFTVHVAPGTGRGRGLWLKEQLRQLVAS